jgi:hypothetical protein
LGLSLADLDRWDPDAIHTVFEAATARAQNTRANAFLIGDVVSAVPGSGAAHDAAQQATGRISADLIEHSDQVDAVGRAAWMAEQEVRGIKLVWQALRRRADDEGFTINLDTDEISYTEPADPRQAQKMAREFDQLHADIEALLARANTADAELADAIRGAAGQESPADVNRDLDKMPVHVDGEPLQPGEVRNLGPVAGTDADGKGIPGIGAADLGEVVQLPNGKFVAVFGDSFSGNKAYDGTHYPSVAVPVTFDDQGKPHFGMPLSGPDGPNQLFPLPPGAVGTDSLPAGSIRMRDGSTYMMVAGTKDLKPVGGSWLVKVTDTPGNGWTPVPGSYQAPAANMPTQISGYQAADGKVYIAADAFDRSQGVSMYRVDPATLADRSTWQPWTGRGFGAPQDIPSPISNRGSAYGELSMREVDGKTVLSGFNATNGPGAVEVRVANDPTSLFNPAEAPPTVVMQQSDPHAPNFVPQNYGGYILPGSTLDNLRLFASQWNTQLNTPYNTQEVVTNVKPP